MGAFFILPDDGSQTIYRPIFFETQANWSIGSRTMTTVGMLARKESINAKTGVSETHDQASLFRWWIVIFLHPNKIAFLPESDLMDQHFDIQKSCLWISWLETTCHDESRILLELLFKTEWNVFQNIQGTLLTISLSTAGGAVTRSSASSPQFRPCQCYWCLGQYNRCRNQATRI